MRSISLSERSALILGALLIVVTAAFGYSTFALLQRIDGLENAMTERLDYDDHTHEQYAKRMDDYLSQISFQCVTAKLELQRVQDDIDILRMK